jgi:uncharacterized protein YfaS (alpha-2-macroglobulin family)
MRRSRVLVCAVAGAVVLASGCGRWRRPKARTELSEAQRRVLAAFTQGPISRESPVRVVFAEAVVQETQLRTPLTPSPFRFDPPLEGLALWTAPNQLEFRPSDRLVSGQRYAATVELEGLLPGKKGLGRLELVFSALNQDLEVQVDGLDSTAEGKTQSLGGKLVTADVDDAPKIEGLLQASLRGKHLKVEWSHEADRRTHAFRVLGIARSEQASQLLLSWDGSPIGVPKKDKREIAIPGLNTFAVDQVRAVQDKETYVELRFTDALQRKQDLRGLVRIGDRDDLRFTVSGNVVQVYAAKGLKGDQTLHVSAGIRNAAGYRLLEARDLAVHFEVLKPQLRFVGKGVVVPTSTGLKIPIETVNLRAVVVEAMRIPDDNLPQFFQVNDFNGERELSRVGRVVWKQTVPLELTPDKENRWLAVGLDLSPLVKASPGGLYRLSLSFGRPQVVWSCPGAEPAEAGGRPQPAPGGDSEQEASYWDLWESSQEEGWRDYEHREDPCSAAYYRAYYDHNVKAARNVLVSDLGLIAKKGEDDGVMVIATDLRSTTPVAGAEIRIRDYQHQTLAEGRTDAAGFARLKVPSKPYLVVARHGGQSGYLRVDDGSALSVAHFDVGGATAPKGLKGFLYGERGVWRPGDTLHLGFILFDATRRLPAEHPARFELLDTRGRLVKTLTRTPAADGFYTFEVTTAADAPTGNYTGRVSVGGATFERVLKIETITPNRLKIALGFGTDLLKQGQKATGTLSASWLHGAIAKGLKADVEMSLQPVPTRFERYTDYSFDDPTRKLESEKQNVFEGRLDEAGHAVLELELPRGKEQTAAGKLSASFTTRVFEPGGGFSIDRFSLPYSPYERYIGIRTPKGDVARGMLLTDVSHRLEIVALDPEGKPAGDADVEVKLYKMGWRWWWEKGEEDFSAYAESGSLVPLQSGVVHLKGGVGSWPFMIKYPEWGRYLITVADQAGGHRTGRSVYIDWPGWAGRGQKEGAGGANVLAFAPDKPEYAVGDSVSLTIPTPKKGRALVTIESGGGVLRADWVEAVGTETRYTFPATAEMAPNVYAHVALLQPHAQTSNDLPIRMYGVALVKVTNRETRLAPVVECADVLAPQSEGAVTVRESQGRPMSYTLALVDEGLLSLTRYATPNPWDYFYAREALSVRTWDLYDFVVGAYGAAFDRLLAIGGDAAGTAARAKRANRFPPLVRFLGPFTLAPRGSNVHKVAIPQYVGAVRVMVVAGRDGAFGAAEKSVFVRRPLMVLGTLPRVLGPEENVSLPVSVFALEPRVKDVSVSVGVSGPLEVVGAEKKTITFKSVGDELSTFELKTKGTPGVGRVVIRAASGQERAEQTIEIDVRTSAVRVVEVVGDVVDPKKTWRPVLKLPGLAGTNEATLEVSRVPPLDLGRRLAYLIQYPHGCVEQTTSSVFPQLYLARLLDLGPTEQKQIEANVRAGLERLKQFQNSEGGFSYWPGGRDADDWASNYAGHFLVEAEKAGYLLPAGLLEQWKTFERRRARGWVPGGDHTELTQAYRLYALALAGAPELGAMNQLRERGSLPLAAQLRLAAAYQLAGQPEAARALLAKGDIKIEPYRELAGTYGSDLRDRAMALESLVLLKAWTQVGPLARSVSESLTANNWLSTQETAYALLALSRCVADGAKGTLAFAYSWNGAKEVLVSRTAAVVQQKLELADKPGASLVLRNTGEGVLYPRLILSGLPAPGQESAASNGIKLELAYLTLDNKPLDPSSLEQGRDLKARVTLTNVGTRGELQEIALSHLFPSGWEIHNERLGGSGRTAAASPFEYQDIRDDRIYSYLSLKPGESKTEEVLLNASYLGRFYAPMVAAEAMYDATINGRVKGAWVRVVAPGRE